MEIESFLQNCRQHDIHLEAENGGLRYCAKKGAVTEEILKTLKSRKIEILRYLSRIAESASGFRLTFTSQDRALLYDRVIWKDYPGRKMDAGANLPHIVIRNTGEIRTDALVKSITALLERYKVLSSAVEMSGGNLYLVHRPRQAPALQEIFLEGDTIEDREQEAMRIANELVWKEFNLDYGPLYKVFLIRLSTTDYILGAGLHHAIGDGISIGILFKELTILYHSIVSNTPPLLPPARFQFMDFLSSMETWLASPAAGGHLGYWTDLLKSTPMTHLLPCDCLSKACLNSGVGAKETIVFDSATARDLKKLAARLKTTLFTALLAIHKAAIWRMTGQEELVIVVVHAGRINVELQTMIGNFASEIAYKTSLAGNPGFAEIIERLKQAMIEAALHQPVPFDWVRRQLSREGVAFSAPTTGFQPGYTDDTQSGSGPRTLRFLPPSAFNDFPGTYGIHFREGSKGIEGTMMYRKDLYEESTVHAFTDHFRKTVTAVISDPEKKLHDLLSPERDL